jgi:hypothetical protein
MKSIPAKIQPEVLWSVPAGVVIAAFTFFVLPSTLDADGGSLRLWIALGAGVACCGLGITMGIAQRRSNG